MHPFIRTLIRRLYSPMTGMMLVSGGAGVLLVMWFGPHIHENGLSASLLGALHREPKTAVVESTEPDQKRESAQSDDPRTNTRDAEQSAAEEIETSGVTPQSAQTPARSTAPSTETVQPINILSSVIAPFGRTNAAPETSTEKPARVSNRFDASVPLAARITKALPGYHYNHLVETKSGAYFFSYDPTEENPAFTWYRLDTDSEKATPQPLLETRGDIGLLFNVAFSPDGTEMLHTHENGAITITDVDSGKTEYLGTFVFSGENGGRAAQYSFPVYTPDGKHILLHDPWHNTLVIVSADEKNIRKGKIVRNVWLEPFGTYGFPESGSDMSMYSFSADGKKVTFGGVHAITL